MQKTVKMTLIGKRSRATGQVDRIFMNLKKKLTPGVILTLLLGYIHVYMAFIVKLLVYMSDLS